MAQKVGNGLDLQGAKIIGIGDPASPQDAVTLQYLQAFVRGLRWKEPVRAASTAQTSLTAPGATMDGVTLTSGDRVLLKNQTAGAENGIYVWTGASATLTRATDADSAAEIAGAAVTVMEGTANADKVYTQNSDTITLGTTALNWVALGGAASTYLAGNGLSLAGSTFSIALDTASGLVVSGTGLKIDTSVVVRKFASTIGTGAATQIDVAHNLGTKDITWSLRDATGDVGWGGTDWQSLDVNTLRLTFATAPASNSLRVVVQA